MSAHTSESSAAGEGVVLEESLEYAGAFFRLGAWCGVMTGAASLAVLFVRRRLTGLIFYPIETVWREPLGAVFSMSMIAVVFVIGRRVWPSVFRWRMLLWLELFLGAFTTLLLIPSLHWAASAALAAGVAHQTWSWSVNHLTAVRRMMRATLIPGLAAIALAAALVPGLRYWRDHRALRPFDASGEDAPNILLIVLDTVRSWNLSAYGYSRPTTPELTQLALRGVLFTRAVSPAPWTLPAHASLFTGRWPHELSTDWKWPLDDTYPTLAEELGARGYLTGGFCANVRYCSSQTGLARGFSHYEDYDVPIRQALAAGPMIRLASRIEWFFRPPPEEDAEGKSRDAQLIGRTFLTWLDKSRGAHTGQPFFAFLNFFDAHRPYTSPDEFHARFSTPGVPFRPNLPPRAGAKRPWDARAVQGSMDAYDASIAYIDREIGNLIRELDRRGILANTIIVITSDHGEEFTEHGMIGHANSLYRASVMVPLVIVAPGRTPAGLRVDAPVSTRDVPRTLLDLFQRDDAARIPGRSLARFWADSSSGVPATDPILSILRYGPGRPGWYPVSHGPVRSVIEGRWRYIISGDKAEELYDFDGDSLEQHNLLTTDSGKLLGARLRALLDSLTSTGELRR